MRRLWIVHPAYLDMWALCTLWRDGLKCQRMIARRETTDNPDFLRFYNVPRPTESIGAYLWEVADFGFYSAESRIELPKWRITAALNPASVDKIHVTADEVEKNFEDVQASIARRRADNSDKHLRNMDVVRREGKIRLHSMFALSTPAKD